MEQPDLITLEGFNSRRLDKYRQASDEPARNGIACPRCHRELFDWLPNEVLASHPPRKFIRCRHCDWMGYRVA